MHKVRNLSFVLQDVEIEVSNKDLDGKQQTELQEIAKSCRHVLDELERIIDNYRDIGTPSDTVRTRAKRIWKRLKWDVT